MVKKKIEEDVVESTLARLRKMISKEEQAIKEPWFLHSGNLALDYIMSGKVDGSGGYPSGLTEMHGDPATGKSLLFALAGAEAQRRGMPFILFDAEDRWNDDFAELHGVNRIERIKKVPETLEDFAVTAYQMIEEAGSDRVVMVLDSLSDLSTIAELEDLEEDGKFVDDQGRRAKKIRQALRGLGKAVSKNGTLLLVSNHTISGPNPYQPKTTSGGKSYAFKANVRLELTKPTPIKIEKKLRPIGVTMHAEVTKNSITPPFGSCDLVLLWSKGINKYSGLLELMVDNEIVVPDGKKYAYKDKTFWAREVDTFVQENPEILQESAWTKPYFL